MSHFACPVCHEPLHEVDRSLRCIHQHSFDRHKKGYINLLLSHHKNTKMPGDNASMVQGRQAFLRAGYYQAFADAIVQLIGGIKLDSSSVIVDAGCGEGYYTEQMHFNLSNPHVYGVDISKPAIHAASSNKQVQWCVASSHRLPFLDHSVDLVTSIFSPVECASFARILKPGGWFIYAGPGAHHLDALKRVVYNEINAYNPQKHRQYFESEFTVVNEQSLQVPISLETPEAIMQLLGMTPHFHRISAKGRVRLSSLQSLDDSADFKLYLAKHH